MCLCAARPPRAAETGRKGGRAAARRPAASRRPRQTRRMLIALQQGAADNSSSGGGGATRRQLLSFTPCSCVVCTAASREFLDRAFAAAMAEGMADYEQSIAPVKRQLFAELLGGLRDWQVTPTTGQPAHLLELGVGTGPNLRFYSEYYSSAGRGSGSGGSGGTNGSLPPLHITGVDPNPFMRPYLEENMQEAGWPAECFTWVEGQAEALPAASASVDAVVCTLVLCSVADVGSVLLEAARVLKPGGQLLFIEHTVAQGQPLLWLAQHALNPLQQMLADNCHLTRDPLPMIESVFQGGVHARRFSVDGASLIAPHVAGLARRA